MFQRVESGNYALSDDALEKTFRDLDQDGNNLLSRREFKKGMKSLKTSLDESKRPSRSDLNQAFRMLDQNKDRKLSLEEFKNVQMMMNSRMPVPLIVLVIAHCSQCQCCICGYFDC